MPWTVILSAILWVLGAAVVLSVISYQHWWAQTQGQSLRHHLRTLPALKGLWFGGLLITLGLLLGSSTPFESVTWGILCLYALIRNIRLQRAGSQAV